MLSLEWKNKLTKHAIGCSVRCLLAKASESSAHSKWLFVIKQDLARMERAKAHN
jgi:hypothetical protein